MNFSTEIAVAMSGTVRTGKNERRHMRRVIAVAGVAAILSACGSDATPTAPPVVAPSYPISGQVSGASFVPDSITWSFSPTSKFTIVTAWTSTHPTLSRLTFYLDGYTRAGSFRIDGFGAGVMWQNKDGSVGSISPPMDPGAAGDCCWYSYGTVQVTTMSTTQLYGTINFSFNGISGTLEFYLRH